MSGSKQITVLRVFRATPDVCAEALELLLKKSVSEMAAGPVPEPDTCNEAAIVRNTEEVSRIEQRPDRPSETTYPAALESAYPKTHKTRRHKSLLDRSDNGRDTQD
jgi:hypothetical protein